MKGKAGSSMPCHDEFLPSLPDTGKLNLEGGMEFSIFSLGSLNG